MTAFGGLAPTLCLSAKACGSADGSGAVNAALVWLWMAVLGLGISEEPEGHVGGSLSIAWHTQFRAALFHAPPQLDFLHSTCMLSPFDLTSHIFLVSII